MRTWIVCKFGGTSVSDRACWETIRDVAQKYHRQGKTPLIVCSAAAGISDRLKQLIAAAIRDEHLSLLQAIENTHEALGHALGLSATELLAEELQQLHGLIAGVALLQEASPKVSAKIMALGELMLTKLGAGFLANQGLDIHWFDARSCLVSHPDASASAEQNYLNAYCSESTYPHVVQTLQDLKAPILMTQGFIAHHPQGETVLLGRGGSDSSAAYFSAALHSERCEIWTDVLGVYTSNPRHIPKARLLNKLNYAEAQEIASMGAKVLHPKCIEPLRTQHIPLHIRHTTLPHKKGTVVSNKSDTSDLLIKSIIMKHNILLISVETIRMWQQVGFLQRVFECFARHGLSIDLISTSETSITVSMDNNQGQYAIHTIDALLQELSEFSYAKVMGPCSSISLVGSNIRMALHQLGPSFALFESQPIHLLSLASNNLNLSFVVDSDQAERLTKQLHLLLIEQHPRSYQLGQSWEETVGQAVETPKPWWHPKKDFLLSLMEHREALYVYDADTITDAIHALKSLRSVHRLFYAMKANAHADILKQMVSQGLNFECVSIHEVERVLQLFPDISRDRLLFTPNFAPRAEYARALELGIHLTVDSAYPLDHWPELFVGQPLLLRIDPGYGAGHHKYVCTGGTDSKFGIPLDQLHSLSRRLKNQGIPVVGLHIHSGSGILSAHLWEQSARQLLNLIELFPSVRYLNLGGGLGIVEKPGQTALDLKTLDEYLLSIRQKHSDIELWLEPGRFLVAHAGVLLSRVTQVKHKGHTTFVGISTGMNSLIRPSLYGAYHEMANLTHLDKPNKMIANVVGPICESADTLGHCRQLPKTQEGDVMLIANTGAYGHVMSSHYNLRDPAQEYFLGEGDT